MAKYKIIPSSRTIVRSPIFIGHKAEKGVEAIEFDLTAWVETYGSGTLTVIMRRWGDAIPYPIALEIDENNKATWTLSDIDTAKAGMTYAQLNYIVGDEVVKKSDIYTFRVMDSLTGEGEPPEAYESWLEHLTHLAAEAMAEVLDIEGVVTDKTLTVDGGIADAKATGDALSVLEDQFSEETDQLKADLGDVRSDINEELYENTVSVKVTPTIIDGERINAQTGYPESYSGWDRTDYIPLTGYNKVSIETENKLWDCAFYDSSKTVIMPVLIMETGEYAIPTNAQYIILSSMAGRVKSATINLTKASFSYEINKKIDEVENEVLYTEKTIITSYVQGSLNSTYGTLDTSSTIRIASQPVSLANGNITVKVDDKYQTNVFFYGDTSFSKYKGMSDWQTGDYVIGDTIQIPSGSNYIRLSVRYTSNTAITPSDLAETDIILLNVFEKTDKSDLKPFEALFVPSNNPNIIYMCRDGRATSDIPPNSVYAIQATAKNQYDKIRFSVSKTTDGEYVAVHDTTINGLAVNKDGTAIGTTINTQSCTLAELNEYDWGLKYGAQYAGMTVPMLDDCLKYASMYGLTVALDIKWTATLNDEDVDALSAMLAKYGQLDAIFFAIPITYMQKFHAKSKRFSFLFAGTLEQMTSQATSLSQLLTWQNHIYLAFRPMGTAPTTDVINFACVNNFDIMYSPIEGMDELTTLGFDKGITLMECHYIENIKKSVMDYADSLIN